MHLNIVGVSNKKKALVGLFQILRNLIDSFIPAPDGAGPAESIVGTCSYNGGYLGHNNSNIRKANINCLLFAWSK